jgi:hypothetical protein
MTATANHYPRAMPYRAQVAPPRRRRTLVLAALAVLLVAGSAGAVVWFNRPAAEPPRTPQERTLEALGSLSASHLYQSYLNIGMLADAVEEGTYTPSQAQEMLAKVVSLMDVVDRQLDRLARGDLSPDDQRDVERIRGLSALLRSQAAALKAYWQNTADTRLASRYHEAREKAWQGLSDVLGL